MGGTAAGFGETGGGGFGIDAGDGFVADLEMGAFVFGLGSGSGSAATHAVSMDTIANQAMAAPPVDRKNLRYFAF